MQSKVRSLSESVINLTIGYFINLGAQIVVFPLFNIHIPLSSNLGIGAIFTVISLTRMYIIRRLFTRTD